MTTEEIARKACEIMGATFHAMWYYHNDGFNYSAGCLAKTSMYIDTARRIVDLAEERDRAKAIIEGYELDYERVVVRGEKCAMELAVEEAKQLRDAAARLGAECKAWRDTHRSDVRAHARVFTRLPDDPIDAPLLVSRGIVMAYTAVDSHPIAAGFVKPAEGA